jgi:uncharacterized protein (TIGR03503 family)
MTISSRTALLFSLFSSYFTAAYLALAMIAATLAAPYAFAQAAVIVEPNADIRVLIDVSGSMKQNDPRNLRRPALDLLVQLFPTDSRAGVWTFGKYVNMLIPHDTVSSGWRNQSSSKSRLINSVALHTNIGLALEKAIYDGGQKKYSDPQKFNTSVILLTDGVVDIDKEPSVNEQERQRILEVLLPQYQAAGITIHAVALSTNADVELLERLAIETDGIFAVAEDAEDLNRIFLRAFDQSSPSDRAPLKDNRFLIDSSVEEFTALVFRQPDSELIQIISPSGQVFNADFEGASLRWFASDAYDLITIQQPEEGEWTINADIDPENRVTIVSDLTLAIAPIANNLYHGETATLIASILEGGEVVSRDEFLDLFTVDASMFRSMSRSNTPFWRQTLVRDGGDESDSVGVYSRELDMLRNSGDYALTVEVDGKTFKREKTLKFTVREPFRIELAANDSEGEFTLTVVADDKRLRTPDVMLHAVILLPDGREQVLDLDSQQAGVWVYQAIEQGTGSYTIQLTASGYNTESHVVDYVLAEQLLYLNVPGISEPIRQPEPEIAVVDELVDELVDETVDEAIEAQVDEKVEDQVEATELVEEKNNWLPYVALIGGNLLLIGLLFFIYKKMMSDNSSSKSDDYSESNSEQDSTVERTLSESTIDNEDKSVPPVVEDEYKEADADVESDDETANKSAEEIVDEENEKVDADAVDISVDEAVVDSGSELQLESTDDSDDTNKDKNSGSDLNELLDIDAEIDADIGADIDAIDNSKEKNVDKDESEVSDDVDIEFDLSTEDHSDDKKE